MTYPPLDILKPVAEDIWIVDSGPIDMGALSFPVRMTVIGLRSGQLWLHSPTRVTAALRAELDRLGTVGHVVAPNSAHWTMVKAWQQCYPHVVTWAAPHLPLRRPVQRAGTKFDHELGQDAPAEWAEDIVQEVVPGGLGYREVMFFHRASRTLILTDLIVNLEADKLPRLTRFFGGLTGTLAPNGKAPVYLRMIVKMRRTEAREAIERMLALEPQRVIFSHGQLYADNGAERLRQSMSWLLRSSRQH